MKGTPAGGNLRRRGVRVGVGSAVAAIALGAASQEAAASRIEVTKATKNGEGSFAWAAKRANTDRDFDRIVFSRRLRGTVFVRGGIEFKHPVEIEGRGYGTEGKRFGRVILKGRGDSQLTFKATVSNQGTIRDLYLDDVGLSSENTAYSVRESYISGDAGDGAGVYTYFGYNDPTRVVDSTVTGFGTGIEAYRSDVIVERSTISSNEGGGGISAGGYTTHLEVRDSTIVGNSGFVGGVRSYLPAEAKVLNSTIVGNVAEGATSFGGGVGGQAVLISHSTITGNAAFSGGGISPGDYSYEMSVGNSIVAGNTSLDPAQGEDCSSPNSYGSEVVSRGGNLIESPGSCLLTGTDLFGVDPLLDPLADNGGPTETIGLRPGSPALGLAIKRFATRRDQRGVERGSDPDSGAFERGR